LRCRRVSRSQFHSVTLKPFPPVCCIHLVQTVPAQMRRRLGLSSAWQAAPPSRDALIRECARSLGCDLLWYALVVASQLWPWTRAPHRSADTSSALENRGMSSLWAPCRLVSSVFQPTTCTPKTPMTGKLPSAGVRTLTVRGRSTTSCRLTAPCALSRPQARRLRRHLPPQAPSLPLRPAARPHRERRYGWAQFRTR
jgi:hypothetical protein